MYNKFQSNQMSGVDENLYKDKTPEQILIEKRAELFLNAAKKNPKKFIELQWTGYVVDKSVALTIRLYVFFNFFAWAVFQ